MDFFGNVLRGMVGIALIMVVVYGLATFGSSVQNTTVMALFLLPIGIAMFLANPPSRQGLAATGVSGFLILLIFGTSLIGWLLLITVAPIAGIYVGSKAFEEWDRQQEQEHP